MDEVDIANDIAATYNDHALHAARKRPPQQPSSGICGTCDEPIDPERLLSNRGAVQCRDCANDTEVEQVLVRKTGSHRLVPAGHQATSARLKGSPSLGLLVPDEREGCDMTNPRWGMKRLCPNCGAKFFDMLRTPVACPKCASVVKSSAGIPKARGVALPTKGVRRAPPDPRLTFPSEAAEIDPADEEETDEADPVDEDADQDEAA